MKEWKFYLALASVAGASFLGALLLPINEIAKTIIGLPFAGALCSALFKLFRDHSAHKKEILKQQREHAFIVAAASHMATVVFDKQVAFSEKYINELHNLLQKLVAEGPSSAIKAESIFPLYDLRLGYRLWLSAPLTNTLAEFEKKVVEMGSASNLWEKGKANKDLYRAYELFYEIMELKKDGDADEKDEKKNDMVKSKKQEGINYVISYLQGAVGIEQLTGLRDSIINKCDVKDEIRK